MLEPLYGSVFRFGLSITATLALTGAPVFAQSFEFAVKKDHFFGASNGTLVFDPASVEYRTADTHDARQWTFDDIKQIQILSPTRITIKTYEDQGWLRLGADRTFEFELTEGEVPPELVSFFWSRVTLPVVTAVLPNADVPPGRSVPVKLRRRIHGSEGALQLYDDRLVYVTESAGDARAWRPADLRTVYQPDRYRLSIDVYEGGGDGTRTFSFDLKQPLPAGFMDLLWRWMHAPSLPHIGDREASR
jgi:hypothetical protein